MKLKLIKNELFFPEVSQLIELGEQLLIRVKGSSMRPFIDGEKDSVLLTKPNENSFKKGNLLLAHLPNGRYVIHRVKRLKGNHIELSGDGNLSLFESCTRKEIIAEVIEVHRGSKLIAKRSLRWNLYKYLWPANPFLRRLFLKILNIFQS